MVVAVVQMKCVTYDKEANFSIAAELIEKALGKKAKLIILPELFNTGYCSTERDWELSEKAGGETEKFLRNYAEKYDCSLIGGFVEKADISGLVYNSLMLVSKGKTPEIYRKIYLWGPEKNRFLKGKDLMNWDVSGISVSPKICYEAGFSENAKIAALSGSEVLVYSSAFGAARLYAWDLATKARALETGCYVLASNHSSVEADIAFCGHSRIVDPMGNVICETTKDNDVVVADIDLEKVYKQRDALPYLRDIDTELVVKGYENIDK